MSSGSSRCTGPGRSSMATRNASRTSVGMVAALTICRAILVSGRIERDHVDDLEARLPADHDRLLAGDHDHRHRAEMRIGRAGGEVQRARPQRGDADAGPAGQPPVGRRHERRRLLVPRQHQLDRGVAQRLDDVEILLARHAEDALDALVLQRRDQQVRPLGMLSLPIVQTNVLWPSEFRPVPRRKRQTE